MHTMMAAAPTQRDQLLDLATEISRDAEAIEARLESRPDIDAQLALVLELRAHRLTLAAALAPPEPARDDKPEIPEGFYEIELMGHRQRSAHLRPVTFAGRQFVEIRTPAYQYEIGERHELVGERVEFYSPAAIFSVSPSSEDEVLAELAERHSIPV